MRRAISIGGLDNSVDGRSSGRKACMDKAANLKS